MLDDYSLFFLLLEDYMEILAVESPSSPVRTIAIILLLT